VRNPNRVREHGSERAMSSGHVNDVRL
jgi:hypothetical protein